MKPDIVIHDAIVLTVNNSNRIYQSGTVVVENSRIREVRPTQEGDASLGAEHVIDGSGSMVMPGLINTHTHLELTPLIGAFSDLDLPEMLGSMTALFGQINEGKYDYLIDAGYKLASLNFLLSGVTTINSMDVHPESAPHIFGNAGLRGFFGLAVTDLFWDTSIDEQFERAKKFIDKNHRSYEGRIQATICPHDDWSCTRGLWERAAELTEEYPELLVHTHLLEVDESNTMARANGAEDSLSLLDEVGLLNDRLVAAHYRVADEQDIQRTAAADIGVAHCPSVFCYWNPDADLQWTPVPELREAGVDVGLGIDDHYWHDSYSMFNEARQARLAANLKREAGQFSSMELVRMLTIEGANALGVGNELGSLEPGKRADLVLLDVEKPKFTPLTNVPAHIVNNASPADVETVVVDGNILLHNGNPRTIDTEQTKQRVELAVERFENESDWDFSIKGSDPPSTVKTLLKIPKRGPVRLLSRLALQSARDSFLA